MYLSTLTVYPTTMHDAVRLLEVVTARFVTSLPLIRVLLVLLVNACNILQAFENGAAVSRVSN